MLQIVDYSKILHAVLYVTSMQSVYFFRFKFYVYLIFVIFKQKYVGLFFMYAFVFARRTRVFFVLI